MTGAVSPSPTRSTARLLTTMVSGLDEDTAGQMLAGAIRGRRDAATLHDYLAAHPDAMQAGDPQAPAGVLRLVYLLADAGHPVTRAACTGCGRIDARLIRRAPSGRVCDMCWLRNNQRPCTRCQRVGRPFQRTTAGVICSRCYQREYDEQCGRCDQIWQVAARLPDGSALCQRCYQRPSRICIRCGQNRPAHTNTEAGPVCDRCYQRPARTCGICGQIRPVGRRATAASADMCDTCAQLAVTDCATCGRTRRCRRLRGMMLCAACQPPRPRRPCARCGQHRIISAAFPIGPVCGSCYHQLRTRPGPCTVCGDNRRLIGATADGAPACGPCAGAGDAFDCRACAAPGQATYHGLCPACQLRARLEDLLTGPDGRTATDLQPLAQALLRSQHPNAILRWLRRSAAARLLTRLAGNGQPITHDHLDQLPPTQPLHAARKVLVACGVLPERYEYIEAVQPWLDEILAGQPVHHRQTITSYARWTVLHRARRRTAFAAPTAATNNYLRTKLRVAIAFLDWLDEHNLTLAGLQQQHLDQWLAGRGLHAYLLRFFIRWARRRELVGPVDIPNPPRSHNGTPATITEDERWHQLHRCLHDDQLPLDLRIAGALLLLYGHPISRTVRLTADAYTTRDDRHYLRLGRTPVLLPPRLATLIRRQLDRPPPTALGKVMNTTTWLLPSSHPGRHREAKGLTDRLATQGITARQGRRAALMALADDLPAAVLASLIGIHISTAVGWIHELKRDWTSYLASRGPSNPSGGTSDERNSAHQQ